MKILILGGTIFIGRHIVEAFLAAGHEVSVFTRGQSPDPLQPEVERLYGNRDHGPTGLHALLGREWDACIDVSGYNAQQVRCSTQALGSRVNRYLFVSSVAVYSDCDPVPITEDHLRKEPAAEEVTELDNVTYGKVKVTCENIVQEACKDRAILLRPQGVTGPFDPSQRYPWWIWRAALGGEMLAPGEGDDYLQVADVRDLAHFTVTALEQNLTGAFNIAGPRITWAEFMGVLGVENPIWVSAVILQKAKLNFMQLPLYRPAGHAQRRHMHLCSQHAMQAGYTMRTPVETVRDTREWALGQQYPEAITREQEAELIAQMRQG